MADISVLIPARDEPYLQKTIDDIFAKASGKNKIEVIAVLDGYWPDPPIRNRRDLILIHRTQPQGLRASINAAAGIAKGKCLLRLDAHCSLCERWDEILLNSHSIPESVSVPVRYKLNPDLWERHGDPREFQYIRREDLKGRDWPEYAQRVNGQNLPEMMTFQGSCWFMPKAYFEKIGGLDSENYGKMGKEAQEISLKAWLSGGRVFLCRDAWYGHWDKDKGLYKDMKAEKEKSRDFALDFWMNDRWTQAIHSFEWLIEKFAPIPTWNGLEWANRQRAIDEMGRWADGSGRLLTEPIAFEVNTEFLPGTIPFEPPLLSPARFDLSLNDRILAHFQVQAVEPPSPVEVKGKGRADLYKLFAHLGYKKGTEIGVWSGRNAAVMFQVIPSLDLFLIDPYIMDDPGFAERCEERAKNRVKGQHAIFIKKSSEDAAPMIPDGSLDFVHIDADTTYDSVMQDIIIWQRKVKRGGIVSGNSYEWLKHTRIPMVVDDYTRAHNINPWFVMSGVDKHPCWFYVKIVDRWPTAREMSYADY